MTLRSTKPRTHNTRQRILDSAEKLFSEQGFSATSLRSIIADAGVNLAAAHYHFGSKEGLISEVFARRIDPVSRGRLEALDRLESRAEPPPTVEEILDAFLRPAVHWVGESGERENLLKLIGRVHHESGAVRTLFHEVFREVKSRFLLAFERALPHLEVSEIEWRMHFMIGSMVHTIEFLSHIGETAPNGSGKGERARHSTERDRRQERCTSAECALMLERMIPFLAAGFRSPATQPSTIPRGRARSDRTEADRRRSS